MRELRFFLFSIILVTGTFGCRKDSNVPLPLDEQISLLGIEFQTLPSVQYPSNNESTIEKEFLGKLLFWDPVLSGEKDVSCATCHHPDFGYSDGLDLSIGVGGIGLGSSRREEEGQRIPRIGRSSPTIINSAFIGMKDASASYDPSGAPMFWDSRMRSLESQCLGPITSFNEMVGDAYADNIALDSVINRLQNIPEYVSLFEDAFPEDVSPVTAENLAKAVASFERTIVSSNSKYDQYVNGDLEILTEDEKEGLVLFFGKANCTLCHKGPMFADYKLTVHGVKDNPEGNDDDLGAGDFKFKTPTLRNIELTAPYTHGGMYATLEEALDFYNSGVSDNINVLDNDLDAHVEPLELSDGELEDLLRFLKTLTDESYDKQVPVSVPSGLNPGGNL
ncbi:MAG: cytochrome-c peroxidase [Flavobacteriales bacterium]|nr:cytochrome-c peroxidase [Flavobacteriales bacterium]